MDSFAGGIHYAYDYSRNSFIPANQAVVATSAPTNYQTAPNFGGQDGKSLSGSHPGSSTSSGPHRALNVDTSTLEALRTERSSSSRAKGPSEAIDNTTSGHIPRPRNAFMIFRAEFSSDKISRSVEHDNRHISRIIGHCWNKLSEEEKLVWRRKADLEKLAHLRKHPDYRFTPTVRTRKPLKRKVNRNGGEELLRCQQVAHLLLLGKEGDDLALAIKQMGPRERPSSSITLPQHHVRTGPYSPPFRSPFLPPSKLPARASSCRFSVPL
ncbi:hypothetical protein GALMADRAFT_340474 [Galerina marginata CBS 339.88]|uniref:HMG box domain-containing protein n=1 Tax=Galerina marginata (strain CBS 339.88) TaxID=685588 RepID=A0A067TSE0_GALM3|nr:hypothetical protein GALMADRAFT_340474 [Galerina marginata CBS 339.88]